MNAMLHRNALLVFSVVHKSEQNVSITFGLLTFRSHFFLSLI
jgi:hypothetical protein